MYFSKMRHIGTHAENDSIVFTHGQDVTPVIRIAEDARQHTSNGWSNNRTMQMIGEIPDVVFFNHPEFYNDDNALRRWLNSDEGQPYRVGHLRHRGDTFNGVIVK